MHFNFRKILQDATPSALQEYWTRLESSAVGKRLLHGAFWSMAGTMIARALALAAAILAARILGKVVYGELGIIQSTVGMFGTLAGFGMGTTSAKFVAELRTKDPTRAGKIIGLSSQVSWVIGSILTVGLVFLAPWLCRYALVAPQLTKYLAASAPLLLLSGISGAQFGVLAGFEAFKSIARVSFLAGLLNFPMVVGGALLFGLGGVIWGLIAAQAGGCLINLLALRREAARYGVTISSSCWSELPVLWRFSVPAVLATLLMSAVNWASTAMLVRQPNGLGEMGAFNAANQWFNALMWLPFILGNVAVPVFAERLSADEKSDSVKLLRMYVKISAVISLPLVALGCLFSPYVMMSYGKGFRDEWPTLVAILITAGLLSLEYPVGQLITASGRMWLGFSSNIGWALIFLGTTPLLLSRGWGALGLASARLLAYFAHAIFSAVYVLIFLVAMKKTPRIGDVHPVPALGPVVSESDISG